ncbi:integrase [Streptomyces solicathayae]|uniref:Integrase n=1 Tax=Streptomyces solicathayae TaxID=3081768 RepID=A0ABZ0M220_9ACTN|nr:integrase [Streptomyces sp. HUAS YS2]WOX25744.1 integrase [Streptomyces sp. HUAS YS2]
MRGTTVDEVERRTAAAESANSGVRRLSRVKAATTSPERQREDVLAAAASVAGHIIDSKPSTGRSPSSSPAPRT